MKTKTLPEEKQWLLHHLSRSTFEQQRFIELVKPLLDEFCRDESQETFYAGYAVSLNMFKSGSDEYNKELSHVDIAKEVCVDDWRFAPSNASKDDCYVRINDVLMKQHLFSFLWFNS